MKIENNKEVVKQRKKERLQRLKIEESKEI